MESTLVDVDLEFAPFYVYARQDTAHPTIKRQGTRRIVPKRYPFYEKCHAAGRRVSMYSIRPNQHSGQPFGVGDDDVAKDYDNRRGRRGIAVRRGLVTDTARGIASSRDAVRRRVDIK
jgi:hypothetical protein